MTTTREKAKRIIFEDGRFVASDQLVDAIQRALDEMREETIEECAKVAEKHMEEAARLKAGSARIQGREIMEEIRRLSETPNAGG
jgi:triphosphoribosyl-dephospho-CoA synthetase